MRRLLNSVLVASLLVVSLPISAQRSQRIQNPNLESGQGLEVTRSDLDKIRNQNQNKNARIVDTYMFCVSFSIVDSVMYISDVQKVDDVIVNNKWFIQNRREYEEQFATFIQGNSTGSLLTSVVYYDKQKKADKKRNLIIRRNNKKNKFKVVELYDFKIKRPDYDTL